MASVESAGVLTNDQPDLKGKALRGGLAKLIAQAAGFGLRIGSLAVLARLLDPRDFGLVAMVTVVTGIFSLFRDAGLSIATVQSPTITREQISTLFWINLLVGVFLTGLTVAIAPAIASFYREPRLFRIAATLAVGFLLNSAGVQHLAVLQRHMRFGWLAGIEVFALLASIVVGLAMAYSGAGYWSLVAMALVVPAVTTLSAWARDPWVPSRPHFDHHSWSMMRFGGSVTFNALIVYLAYNADKILLGRFWGAETLGMYSRAYQLVSIPNDNLYSAIGGVAISALARVQNDGRRFRNYFLGGYSMVLALTIPITLSCALFAEDIVIVLLGPKWVDAVRIFQLLAPTIVAYALINPLSWVLFSTGRVRRSAHMALVIAPLVIASYAGGLPFGPLGVAAGYSLMMALLVAPMVLWALHGTVVTARELLAAAKAPFLSALAAVLVGFGVRGLLGDHLPPLLKLVVESASLFGSYALALLYVGRQWNFYLNLFRQATGRSGA